MVFRDDSATPALECRALSKTYGSGRIVLAQLDFTLRPGEFVAIMGDSGVGKSTLLNLIAGLDSADSGDVIIDGNPVSQLDDNAATRLRRQKLGFVFQAFHVLPHLTLAQNVALPLLLNDLPASGALDMLAAVGLGGRGDDFPRQLSGGELQRVAIARALVHRPKLILADEPTGNLDPDTAHDVLGLFRTQSKATGAATIMVTHSEAAAAVADRILILNDGGLHASSAAQAANAAAAGARAHDRSTTRSAHDAS
ncbi:ABC transporter ATP-binding protein [Paraburkholderia xenovorans]|uniref:ABC transporter ATP-binding protein n=1 Tax=Paraburkholderia xenovorans TaxID=36873 RepID=UPI0038B730A8